MRDERSAFSARSAVNTTSIQITSLGWYRTRRPGSVVWSLGGGRSQPVAPGDYTVTLRVGDVTETRVARVKEPVVVPRPL